MLRIKKTPLYGLKYPLYASLTLSFASFGDAFLYPFLPQNAEVMDIPVVWIGLLLSINRFIRIGFNPVVIRLFAMYGVRAVTIVASGLAIASTIGYGLGWGLFSLITFRIIWGMSFAILRLSTLAYAFDQEYVGTALGISRSIQEAGPMLALWWGPLLLNYFSVANTFLMLGLISGPSILYALALPKLKYAHKIKYKIRLSLPSLLNTMTFVSSFIVEGVLIIVAGVLLTRNYPSLSLLAITSMAGAYLAYRRFCSILFAPYGGVLADKVGFQRVFNYSMLLIIVGLISIIVGWTAVGLIIIFSFNSINSAMAPGGASHTETDKIKAVAVNASWRDFGAAIGALTGGLLLSGRFLFEILLTATFVLSFLLTIRFWQKKKI